MMVVLESVAASPSFPQERIEASSGCVDRNSHSHQVELGTFSGDVGRVHLEKSVRTEWNALAEI